MGLFADPNCVSFGPSLRRLSAPSQVYDVLASSPAGSPSTLLNCGLGNKVEGRPISSNLVTCGQRGEV